MSLKPINRSPDLKRLRDEGYDIEVRSGFLIVKDVPYLNAKKEVQSGMLVSPLTMANDVTTEPDPHTLFFAGEYPCREDGTEIDQIRNDSTRRELVPGLTVNHQFSAKPQPTGKYADYYAK